MQLVDLYARQQGYFNEHTVSKLMYALFAMGWCNRRAISSESTEWHTLSYIAFDNTPTTIMPSPTKGSFPLPNSPGSSAHAHLITCRGDTVVQGVYVWGGLALKQIEKEGI